MSNIKLGIDLSTTQTGWSIGFYEQSGLATCNFDYVCLWNNDYFKMWQTCNAFAIKIKDYMIKYVKEQAADFSIDIGIELANFASPKTTCKFNLLSGILIGSLYSYLNTSIKSLKMFNANEWYKLIGNLNDERIARKANSIKIATQLTNCQITNDNIADAINIMNNLDKCNDHQVIAELTKQKKQQKKNMLKAELKKQKEVNNLQKKIILAKTDKTKQKYSIMLEKVKNNE